MEGSAACRPRFHMDAPVVAGGQRCGSSNIECFAMIAATRWDVFLKSPAFWSVVALGARMTERLASAILRNPLRAEAEARHPAPIQRRPQPKRLCKFHSLWPLHPRPSEDHTSPLSCYATLRYAVICELQHCNAMICYAMLCYALL